MSVHMQTSTVFGTTPDGIDVDLVTIEGGGLTANIMTYGASVQDLRLKDHHAPMVLGFSELTPYLTEGRYFGATVGRFANRISKGKISIDQKLFQLDQNSDGVNTLHGGRSGFSQQVWEIENQGKSHITLVLHDPHLAMGFPANCKHLCHYELKDDGVLEVIFTTTSDAPTVVSLAHHSYFILDETDDCLNHQLQIDADHYLPVDKQLIPTGTIQSVEDTVYDFRTLKRINTYLTNDVIYDHNFCLSSQRTELRHVAQIHSEQSGISLNIATTEPGLQFYAAHGLKTVSNGLQGKPYQAHSGFCLETQIWPDAPNRSNFPNSVLRVGETLQQVTRYQFQKD